VWLTFLLFNSNFSHRTSALLSCFVLEVELAFAESASSWNFKSVGAQSSADFFFPTQILAVGRNVASASAQVLAEG
jgi:hypothetical protein